MFNICRQQPVVTSYIAVIAKYRCPEPKLEFSHNWHSYQFSCQLFSVEQPDIKYVVFTHIYNLYLHAHIHPPMPIPQACSPTHTCLYCSQQCRCQDGLVVSSDVNSFLYIFTYVYNLYLYAHVHLSVPMPPCLCPPACACPACSHPPTHTCPHCPQQCGCP